jgi:hypothetical protein
MKTFIAILCLAAAIGLFSCHKDNSHPGTNPPTDSTKTTGSMKISLSIPPDTTSNDIEVIISELQGNILLDTLAAPNTILNASMSTKATLVDVSFISAFQNQGARYSVITYRGINPSSWTGPFRGSSIVNLLAKTTSPAELYYKHLPEPDFQFNSSAFDDGKFTINSDGIDVHYNQIPGGYTSILFPSIGLFILHMPKGLNDTIDCNTVQYDTAVSANYPSSPNYNWVNSQLVGVIDSTDPRKCVTLCFNYPVQGSFVQHLLYPRRTKFQKYWSYSSFTNASDGSELDVYGYLNSVDAKVNYPAPNAYVFNSTQNTNFSITFNSSKPTYYRTDWTNNTIFWSVYSSPDSTQFNPLGFWTAQKSKLLKGQDLSQLAFNYFVTETVPGYDYVDFFNWAGNAKLHDAKPVSGSTFYSKFF